MKKNALVRIVVYAVIAMLTFGLVGRALGDSHDPNDHKDLFEMSLEDLMDIEVVSASRQPQKIARSSGRVGVITAEDIHYSGLTSIGETLQFTPGIDAAGMTVIGTAGTQRGRELVAKQGAHHVLDHHKAAYMQKAMALTNSRGFDVVLEMLANVNLGRDLEVMAKNGRIVVIGCRGTVEINPRLAMQRDLSIIGMITTNAPDQEIAAIQEAIQTGLKDGTLRPVVAQSLPLPQAPNAHQEIIESSHYGKIVLIP